MEFIFKQSDYINWTNDFAIALGSEVKNNSILFSPHIAVGTTQSFFLEDGFSACVNNYSLNNEVIFTRHPADQFGVIIYLYHFHTSNSIEYKIDNTTVNVVDGTHYALQITNAQTFHQLKFTKSTIVRGLSIYLENDWIQKNASNRALDVFNYLKQVNYFQQFFSAKQKRLMDEILDMPENHSYPELYIKSRIYRILDKLMETFLQRDISELPERISEDDFQTLQKIETILTKSYDKSFPGIEKLSRISFMSESKLKKLFKQSFGMGLFEYFQKNRMHKAKEHILSGKYTITEAGIKLGYQNLSNFSAAFRKEFQCLPSELNTL